MGRRAGPARAAERGAGCARRSARRARVLARPALPARDAAQERRLGVVVGVTFRGTYPDDGAARRVARCLRPFESGPRPVRRSRAAAAARSRQKASGRAASSGRRAPRAARARAGRLDEARRADAAGPSAARKSGLEHYRLREEHGRGAGSEAPTAGRGKLRPQLSLSVSQVSPFLGKYAIVGNAQGIPQLNIPRVAHGRHASSAHRAPCTRSAPRPKYVHELEALFLAIAARRQCVGCTRRSAACYFFNRRLIESRDRETSARTPEQVAARDLPRAVQSIR